MEVKIAKLIKKKNQTETTETEVFADCYPVGRDEFNAAGQNGLKPSFRADIWGTEYGKEPLVEIEGVKYDIYRTYGPKPNGKIELYLAERTGRK